MAIRKHDLRVWKNEPGKEIANAKVRLWGFDSGLKASLEVSHYASVSVEVLFTDSGKTDVATSPFTIYSEA